MKQQLRVIRNFFVSLEYLIVGAANLYMRHRYLWRRTAVLLAKYGYFIYVIYGVVLWFAGKGGIQQKKRRFAALQTLCSVLLGAAASFAVGKVWKRMRPFQRYPEQIQDLIAHKANASFPSNHMMNSWIIARTMAANQISGSAMLTVWSILVGLSRIAVGVHYPSDLAGGMLLAEWSRRMTAKNRLLGVSIAFGIQQYEKLEKILKK